MACLNASVIIASPSVYRSRGSGDAEARGAHAKPRAMEICARVTFAPGVSRSFPSHSRQCLGAAPFVSIKERRRSYIERDIYTYIERLEA